MVGHSSLFLLVAHLSFILYIYFLKSRSLFFFLLLFIRANIQDAGLATRGITAVNSSHLASSLYLRDRSSAKLHIPRLREALVLENV